MGIEHDHSPRGSRRRLITKLSVATAATLTFVVLELSVGIYANSLALIGDSFHNFTDALALTLALFSIRLAQRPPTAEKSYGYQRAGVLVAFVNAGTLVGFTLYMLVEAWKRFRHPQTVDSVMMMGVAGVALILNFALTLWLRSDGERDVGVRSAVIHLLGDAFSSAGVLAAGFLIHVTGSSIFDPIVSVLIAFLILWSSWGILRETVNLLLEGTPSGIDPDAVQRALSRQAGVLGVHHLHIWAIAARRPALSCHLQLGDVSLRETGVILGHVAEMLRQSFGIEHTTIQFEQAGCPEDDPFCSPLAGVRGE